MNDSMVDRLDDQDPVTITEALEIPQPRAVGSPLPRGNGNRVVIPPTYADLEDRSTVSQLRPVLAPPPLSNFSFASSPLLATAPAGAPVPGSVPQQITLEQEKVSAPVSAVSPNPAAQEPATVSAPRGASQNAPAERPQALQARPPEQPSTLKRAAGIIRHAIPIVQKFLPLLDGNIASVVSNILSPAAPAPPAPPAEPVRVDLTPLKEEIAELQVRHQDLLDQVGKQNYSLKRVEDHLDLVKEATDRNTLEQQELLEDLKKMGRKVNIVAAIAISLLAISLAINLVLFLHIQRVLP